MLPRAHRMKHGADFRVAMRSGNKAVRKTLVVHAASSCGVDSPALVGFAVSKSVGNAVVRNRVRRQLRHLASEELRELSGGSCVVVRALPAARSADYPRLRSDLHSALADLRNAGALESTGV